MIDKKEEKNFSGNILLFYFFDVGDEFDFDSIKRKKLLKLREIPSSPYFKNYHIPLSFEMPEFGGQKRNDCVLSKAYSFGAFAFCYSIPFNDTFDTLKHKIIDIHNSYDRKSEDDARNVFEQILPAIESPHFYQMKNSYFVVQMNLVKDISAQEFEKSYGSKIASLLRLETQTLSDYQIKDILDSTTGYYGQDFMIIDSEASFIYDDEYYETLEFFESANIQLLELQYFDRLLDNTLKDFYLKPLTISWKAYIPLIGRRMDTSISKLARLRVDISVIVERLEGSIKMVGDAYYSKIYSVLVHNLSLGSWKESINKKLDIISDLYTVYQHRLERTHEEILTIVIIILIALEAIFAFMGK
jgi:hypothetical protein